MLGLPRSTEVNRRVAKEKLYANANMNPQLRDMIKDGIEAIIWRNKLAENTLNVRKGESVTELQVFEIQLRQRGLDKRALTAITGAIPYKILFVLTFESEAQVWLNISGTFYNTDWLPIAESDFRFDGLTLDTVYENLARQISGGRLDNGDIAEAVDRDRKRQKLERDIAALEKKLLREKQFNRQVEMNGELKRMQGELEGLG